MKKISVWLVAIITCFISLAAMCMFDIVLSLIYYFTSKVPFLSELIDFVGEILDLGLTVIVAFFIAISIWSSGHSVIKKISGKAISFQDSPISCINSLLFFVFLAMVIFFGFEFATSIGKSVMAYTTEFQGAGKILMFLKAIKDTFIYICNENMIFYKIGTNSLLLFGINIFSDKFID